MAVLIITTEGGQLARLDTETGAETILFTNDQKESTMGICLHKGHYYVSSKSCLFRIDAITNEVNRQTEKYNPSTGFHQMQFYDDKLYTTVTKRNAIWIYDEDLNLLEEMQIAPPLPDQPAEFRVNYNHLNNIIRHEGKFYVNLNWLTETQYGSSGVAVLDESFNELERFEYGWETHDFVFLDGKKVAICGSSNKSKNLNHVYKAGLMVDGELVWEHDPDEWFCKGLGWDDDHIYLGGGQKSTRLLRWTKDSIIFVLDRKTYKQVKEIRNKNIRSVKGIIVLEN